METNSTSNTDRIMGIAPGFIAHLQETFGHLESFPADVYWIAWRDHALERRESSKTVRAFMDKAGMPSSIPTWHCTTAVMLATEQPPEDLHPIWEGGAA